MPYLDLNAIQLRVTLAEIEPQVWRRLVVPGTWHLGQLHLVIQAAFNWWNYHLHEYRIGGLRYGDPETDDGSFEDSPSLFDERGVRLCDFEREPGTTFIYTYDFGDNWRHVVEIEKHLALDPLPKVATCVDGARARPPEDVGGVGGYERFLEVMADPLDPEYGDTKRWCGSHFDPAWFDLATVAKDVHNALRPSARRRQFQPKPKRVTQPEQ
jgi:hypothetical protein